MSIWKREFIWPQWSGKLSLILKVWAAVFVHSLVLFLMFPLFSSWIGSLPHFHHQSSAILISYVTDTALTTDTPSSHTLAWKMHGTHTECRYNSCGLPVPWMSQACKILHLNVTGNTILAWYDLNALCGINIFHYAYKYDFRHKIMQLIIFCILVYIKTTFKRGYICPVLITARHNYTQQVLNQFFQYIRQKLHLWLLRSPLLFAKNEQLWI
jgi:hypothetical protein